MPADNIAPIVERFEAVRAELPGAALTDIRAQAIESFAAEGFPGPRNEAWRYTNLNRLARTSFDPLADAPTVSPENWKHLFLDGTDRIAIVNGRFDETLSDIGGLPDGVVISPLSGSIEDIEDDIAADTPESGAPLVALNTAFMRDGLLLKLPEGCDLARPVQVLHIVDSGGQSVAVHPRTLISAAAGSRATVIETFVGAGESSYWTNSVSEARVGPNAEIAHVKLQAEAGTAFHTAVTRVRLDRDARYHGVALATGASLSRNEIRVAFEGPGADCAIHGGALLRDRQHADNTTEADHLVPHTTASQLFRNVLDDRARSVFQGGVIVRQDAQKTDSSQSSANLLLSQGAQADTKPELQIFADDVKCAHGATVGDLDADAMFYLQSRGIAPDEAKALLIEAFIGEVLEGAPEGIARDHLADAVAAWMNGGAS